MTQKLYPSIEEVLKDPEGCVWLQSPRDYDNRGWFSLHKTGKRTDAIQIRHFDWTVITAQFFRIQWKGDAHEDMSN